MAAFRTIEAERGTYVGSPRHPHNGYFAGDFSQRPVTTAKLHAAYRTPHN